MKSFDELIKKKDLRSIGESNDVAANIHTQDEFDALFKLLFHPERKMVMLSADAVEKVTVANPSFLEKHKKHILSLLVNAKEIELKWHLAQLVPRISLTKTETGTTWHILTSWAADKKESRIVRTNSLHSLFLLTKNSPELLDDFNLTVSEIKRENIPSINARLRKLKII